MYIYIYIIFPLFYMRLIKYIYSVSYTLGEKGNCGNNQTLILLEHSKNASS